MEKEVSTLYIPQGIKIRKEYFPGFGKVEALKSAFVIAVCGGIDVLLYIFTQNTPKCVLFMMVSSAAAFIMLSKDPMTNVSVVDQVATMIRYFKSQKFYPYKALNEWKEK